MRRVSTLLALLALLLLALAELERAGLLTGWIYWWDAARRWIGRPIIAIVLALTLYSGLGYLWKNLALIGAG